MSNEAEDLYLVLGKAPGDNPDYIFVEVARPTGESVQIATGEWEQDSTFTYVPIKAVVQGE